MAEKKKNTDRYYIDNKVFYTDMLRWWTSVQDARERGEDDVPMPRIIGDYIIRIVNALATKYNFSNYPFVDEMISDAMENLVAAAPNFDPNKSNNPFGYFSMVAYFAFVRRIQKEKKMLVGKYMIAERGYMSLQTDYSQEELDSALSGILDNEYMKNLVKETENLVDNPVAKKEGQKNTWRLKKHRDADELKKNGGN